MGVHAWCLGLVGVVSLGVATPAAAADAPPWEVPFAEPSAVVEAAAAATAGRATGEALLFSSASWSFDDAGRLTWTYRSVSRLQDRDAVDSDDGVVVTWNPWRQDRPEVRARVVLADGTAHELDPAGLLESSRARPDGGLYDDAKVLEGPLPNLAVGAVVEISTTVREHKPMFAAGRTLRSGMYPSDTLQAMRLEISAPTGTKLRLSERDFPKGAKTRTVADGRVIHRWALPPQDPLPEYERAGPRPTMPGPIVEASTGQSWKAVATAYSDAVDAALQGVDLEAIAGEAVGDAKAPQEIVERALRWVVGTVRYTGLELGENALVPVSPRETLDRGFGDCKDQSTLLVGILRARGLDAHVALLDVGGWYDVPAELPGLGLFDHAIVHVGGKTPIWADPTDRFSRAGVLPEGDQGRLSLVASRRTRGLVRTPVLPAAEAVWWEESVVDIPDEASAVITHRFGAQGHIESELRSGYAGSESGSASVLEWAQTWAKDEWDAAAATAFTFTDPDEVGTPFVVEATVEGSRRAGAGGERARALIDTAPLVVEVANAYRGRPDPADPREGDAAIVRPHTTRFERRVVFPPGYVITQLPEPVEGSASPASWSLRVEEVEPEGDRPVVVARGRFVFEDTSRDRITAAEMGALRTAVTDLIERDYLIIEAEHRSEALLAAGDYQGALEVLRAEAASRPEDPLPPLREALVLGEAGMGHGAQAAARRATEIAPDQSRPWLVYAWALSLDGFGRTFEPGWKRPDTLEAYRRALEIVPDSGGAKLALAAAMEYGASGVRYAEDADVAGSVAILSELSEEDAPGASEMLWSGLARLGRLDELERRLRGVEGDVADALMVSLKASRDGAEAAITEARRRVGAGGDAEYLLGQATLDLFARGEYGAANRLLRTHFGAAVPTDMLEALDALVAVETLPERMDLRTPEGVAFAFFEAVARGPRAAHDPVELLSEAARGAADVDALRAGQLGSVKVPDEMDGLGLTASALLDLGLSASEVSLETFGKGVAVARLDLGDNVRVKPTCVLVKEKGRWRVAGSNEHAAPLGAELGARLERTGKAAGVDDYLKALRTLRTDDDKLLVGLMLIPEDGVLSAEDQRALADLWTCTERAACIEVLRGGEPSFATRFPPASWLLFEALAEEGRWSEYADLVLRAKPPGYGPPGPWDEGTEAPQQLEVALATAAGGDLAGARRIAESGALEGLEASAQEGRMWLDVLLGDVEALDARTREMVDDKVVSVNEIAWARVLGGLADDATVSVAESAARQEQAAASVHTLATVYAERDEPSRARRALEMTLKLRGDEALTGADWYVVGRIAESYGLPGAAREAYGRVPEEGYPHWKRTRRLVERRLEALGAP